MTKYIYELNALNLQLFAEGGEGGTGAEGSMAGTGEFAGSAKGVNGNPTNVQTADAQTTDTNSVVDRKAEFEKLIKGEYKDLYDERVQNTVKNRLKGTQEQLARLNSLTPLLEMIAEKYGVDSQDAEALVKAIEDDNSYYEEEAIERGLTVEELKRIKKIEKENAAFKNAEKERKAAEQYRTWLNQAEEAKKIYPGLDLDEELKNEQFGRMLLSGVDVKAAYQVMHQDEIIGGAMRYTAQTVEKKVADKIAANGRRPSEGGMSSQSASVGKTDVSQFNDDDIAKVLREVRSGKRVVL